MRARLRHHVSLTVLIAVTATSLPALAQAPSNEELYKIVMGLKAEQEKLREENRRVKAEASEARAELRRLRGDQKTTQAKVDAATKPSTKSVAADPCAAYGPGYLHLSRTSTCIRVGGYARVEGQFAPQQKTYMLYGVNRWNGKTTGLLQIEQEGGVQDTFGAEVRGRVDVEAVTPTDLGEARMVARLRVSSSSGSRTGTIANNAGYAYEPGVLLKAVPEAAFLRVAGFTVGIAPSNYALMPTSMYTGTPWAQYTNGVAQVAYRHDFGSGFSVTGALERAKDWAYNMSWSRPSTALNLVANAKWEQNWGWLALHGAISGNSIEKPDANVQGQAPDPLDPGVASLYGGDTSGQKRYNAAAIGVTANFKLPALGPRDEVWLTANYTNGNLGALLAAGGLSNISNQNNGALIGGILRADENMMITSGDGTEANPYRVKNVQGFGVAAMLTHHWSAKWRSNFNAGYVQINPPKSLAYESNPLFTSTTPIPMWGRGQLVTVAGSLIYSIAENFDVGIEGAYAYLRNDVQNAPQAYELTNFGPRPYSATVDGPLPGLKQGNAIVKMRMDRLF